MCNHRHRSYLGYNSRLAYLAPLAVCGIVRFLACPFSAVNFRTLLFSLVLRGDYLPRRYSSGQAHSAHALARTTLHSGDLHDPDYMAESLALVKDFDAG